MSAQLDPVVLLVRARRILVRPGVRRALVLLVAATTGLAITAMARSAESARRRWGDSRTVVVARHDLAPGDLVETGDVELRRLPTMALAEDVLDQAPVGAVVRQPVSAGEPLVAARMAPHGLTGAAALIPDGHRGVAVPTGPTGRPPLGVGDRVDLLAVIPREADLHGHGDGTAAASVPLAEGAVVVDVADQAVTVAVPRPQASTVAYAAAQGTVAITLTGA